MEFSSDNRRGIICLLVGGMGFSISNSLTKLCALSLPLGEVLLIRGMATSILFVGTIAALRQLSSLKIAKSPKVLGRSFFEVSGTIFYILAITHTRIADTAAIVLSSPIIITLVAIVIYHERVGWHRWGAIIFGMIGVIFIIKPNPGSFDSWTLLAVLAAFSSAARDLITRNIDKGASTLAITLVAAIAVTFFGLLLSFGDGWISPSLPQVALLVCAGTCYGLGIYMNVLAFSGAVTVSVVSPFRYTMLLWITLVAYLIFGELPDRYTIVGSILIIGSGLYVLHREMVRRRYLTAMGPLEQRQVTKND